VLSGRPLHWRHRVAGAVVVASDMDSGGCGRRLAYLDILATQLTAALDGPLLLYVSAATLTDSARKSPNASARAGTTWSSESAGHAERPPSNCLPASAASDDGEGRQGHGPTPYWHRLPQPGPITRG
jgi:hypothetical protein